MSFIYSFIFKEPNLFYGNRDEQGQILQLVLSASDMDADEERIPGEGPRPVSLIEFKTKIDYIFFLKF